MSIFRRLYDILKSEIGHRWSETPSFDQDAGSRSGPHQDRRWRTDDEPKDHTPPPKHDKLAQYYANLEVPYGSDLQTVHKAWKRQLTRYHPDLYSADAEKQQVAHELTQQLNHAYQELKKHLEKKAR